MNRAQRRQSARRRHRREVATTGNVSLVVLLQVSPPPSPDLVCSIGPPCAEHRHDDDFDGPCGQRAVAELSMGDGAERGRYCAKHAMSLVGVFGEHWPAMVDTMREWLAGPRTTGFVISTRPIDGIDMRPLHHR